MLAPHHPSQRLAAKFSGLEVRESKTASDVRGSTPPFFPSVAPFPARPDCYFSVPPDDTTKRSILRFEPI